MVCPKSVGTRDGVINPQKLQFQSILTQNISHYISTNKNYKEILISSNIDIEARKIFWYAYKFDKATTPLDDIGFFSHDLD